MQRYVRKPVLVHAFKWDGDPRTLAKNLNQHEIQKYFKVSTSWLLISTPSGIRTCSVGDYVIKSGQGVFSPCEQKLFKQWYRKA